MEETLKDIIFLEKKWRIKKDVRLNDLTKYIWQKSSFSWTSLSFSILPSYNNYFSFLFNPSEYRWKNLVSRNFCKSRPKHNWQIKDNITKRRKKKIQPNVDNIFQDLKWHELKSYKLLEYNIKETFTWQKLIWKRVGL